LLQRLGATFVGASAPRQREGGGMKRAADDAGKRLRRYWDKHARTYDREMKFWERICSAMLGPGSVHRRPATSSRSLSAPG
jgi:hypothetical protein